MKKTIKLATSPEMMADVCLRPSLESLATHRKGVYALWRFIASGTWSKIPGLTTEKIGPVGELVLDCLTRTEYSASARKYLEGVDSGVRLPLLLLPFGFFFLDFFPPRSSQLGVKTVANLPVGDRHGCGALL
jgi:hypothetical protein